MTTEQVLKEAAGELSRIFAARNIVGEPLDLGDRVVIPITRFGLGFGAGGEAVKDSDASGAGGAGGIEPVALLVVHKDVKGPDGVQIFSLKKENPVAQVITALSETVVPQVVDLIKNRESEKDTGKKTTEE